MAILLRESAGKPRRRSFAKAACRCCQSPRGTPSPRRNPLCRVFEKVKQILKQIQLEKKTKPEVSAQAAAGGGGGFGVSAEPPALRDQPLASEDVLLFALI